MDPQTEENCQEVVQRGRKNKARADLAKLASTSRGHTVPGQSLNISVQPKAYLGFICNHSPLSLSLF